MNKKQSTRIYLGQTTDIRGLRYHYLDEGQGDPIVMVHGNPSWSLYYRNLVSALKSNYRCIVPDHIGCGLSEKPDDEHYNYTLANRIDDLEALLEKIGIHKNITLIVHDWGGMIGMGYATRHPKAIKKIVLLNTAAFDLPEGKKNIPRTLNFIRNSSLGAWLIEHMNAFSVGASWIGCKQNPMSRNLRQAYQMPYHKPGDRIATLRFVQDIPVTNADQARPVLLEIQDKLHLLKNKPMLICWGMKDFVFDRYFLEEWERRFPEAEVYRFPAAGHYILEDASADLIPLITDFVAPKHLLKAQV